MLLALHRDCRGACVLFDAGCAVTIGDILIECAMRSTWSPQGNITKPAVTIDTHHFNAIAMGILDLIHSLNLSTDQASG